jgi:serine/threonine protein kinase
MSDFKNCPFCGKTNSVGQIRCANCGSILSSDPTNGNFGAFDLFVKKTLQDRYDLIGIVGKGGMAVVYKAIQKSLNRPVAIKVIHENLVHDDEFLNRFLREAKVSASLNHRNIVQVYDVGSIGKVHYMAMEFLSGITLNQLIKHCGHLSPTKTIHYCMQVAGGLAYIHQNGLVHRDMKSSNIIITHDDRAVIMDFGVVFVNDSNPLSMVGAVLGTPEYMSPEQAEGKIKLDGRSDIFSLGIIMYECLNGKVPFQSSNPLSTIHQVIHDKPRPPHELNRDLPVYLSRIVMKCLEKDRNLRYRFSADLFDALIGNSKTIVSNEQYTRKINIPIDNQSAEWKERIFSEKNPNKLKKFSLPLIKFANPSDRIVKSLILVVAGIMILFGVYFGITYFGHGAEGGGGGDFETLQRKIVVLTSIPTTITLNSAVSGGKISNSKGSTIINQGLCWDTSSTPTIYRNKLDGIIIDSNFSLTINGLFSNTKYYLRAFAQSNEGITYGNEVQFTTLVNTESNSFTIGSVTINSAIISGTLSPNHAAGNVESGICWSLAPAPTVESNHTIIRQAAGNYTITVSGLEPGKKYYARLYTNTDGTIYYGTENSFNTLQNTITAAIITTNTASTVNRQETQNNLRPVVLNTNSVTLITPNSAVCGGRIVSDGGSPITYKGICWSTAPNPDISDYSADAGNGRGEFTASMNNLTENTKFYVRAFAENAAGQKYGNEQTFTTTAIATTTTTTTTNIQAVQPVLFRLTDAQLNTARGLGIELILVTNETLGDFYIGKFEIKQSTWSRVMGNNPSRIKIEPNCPVESVSLVDINRFLGELRQLTGINFSLPSESEWEYAASGGSRSNHTRYSGSNNISNVVCNENNAESYKSVGSQVPNELGIYDMSGNVWELCSGSVIKGGSYMSTSNQCTISSRRSFTANWSTGFRVCVSN